VAIEDVARLKARSVHVIEVTFAAAPPAGLFALPGVEELRRDGNVVHVQSHGGIDAVIKAIAQYEVIDLRTQQQNLEDVFLAYYSNHAEAAAENDESERRYAAS
jgi:ABC-2 type transport system ATP-binding protein